MKNALILIVAAFLLASCTPTSDKKADKTEASDSSSAVVLTFRSDTISNVYKQYITLKNALVNSNQKSASVAGENLSKSLQMIDGCGITANLAKNIQASSDLKTQRLQFIALSSDLVALMKHAEISSGSIFVDYCPMINSAKGGYWLASEKKIQNPYYGKQMMTCGEVKQEIKSN